MATIRKREGKKGISWQIDYFDPNGQRVRQSFKKKKHAEAELGKRVSLIAEKRYLDVKKDYKTTLGSCWRSTRRITSIRPVFKVVSGGSSMVSRLISESIPGYQIFDMWILKRTGTFGGKKRHGLEASEPMPRSTVKCLAYITSLQRGSNGR